MTQDSRKDRPDNGILDAQLEALMDGLGVERAPASLRRKLKCIPREERRRNRQWNWQPPRWALAPALAVIPLLVIGVVLMQPQAPSPAEVQQARQDLALAFSYLDKAGYRTGDEIQRVLGDSLGHTVKDGLSRNIPFTEQFRKEESS